MFFIQRLAVSRGPASASMRMLAGAASSEQEQSSMMLKDSADKATKSEKTQQHLQLNTGGFIIPHPQKVAKGGEDAYYIARNQRSFGVADGVGGWGEAGVDPGNFARNLMREARKAAEATTQNSERRLDSFQILCTALANSRHVIGDSGFVILRDGKLLAASPPQQHRFNFPYQIGTKGNPVTAAQNFVCKLKPGDVLVAGTDGLFDNVFSHRTTKLVWDAKEHGALPGVAAQQLATFASARSMDPVYRSPFARAAGQAGFFYRGGKVDDITVVVSYVTAAKTSATDAAGGDAQGSAPLGIGGVRDGSQSTFSSSTTAPDVPSPVSAPPMPPSSNSGFPRADAEWVPTAGAAAAGSAGGGGGESPAAAAAAAPAADPGSTPGAAPPAPQSGGAAASASTPPGAGGDPQEGDPLADAISKIAQMSKESKL